MLRKEIQQDVCWFPQEQAIPEPDEEERFAREAGAAHRPFGGRRQGEHPFKVPPSSSEKRTDIWGEIKVKVRRGGREREGSALANSEKHIKPECQTKMEVEGILTDI